MGYNDGFDFEDENENQLSGKALRDARDAAAKKAHDLEKQLAEVMGKLTERNLKDVLQAKTLNPGLARFMKADGIDGSDESKVDAWLSENGELFGIKKEETPAPVEEDPRQKAFNAMNNVQVNALPAGKFSEVEAAINKAETFEDVNAALKRAAGIG